MFGLGFSATKTETQVRLCNARIKLQKNKRTIALKAMRKEVSELLRSGKQEYARIRIEGVIRENLLLQAYEILSLYLELIAVRSQLIAKTKEIPRDMVEAISSIIYAAQRISDVPELSSLRAMFASKYSKEYAAEAAHDQGCTKWQVNHSLIKCLLVEPPLAEDKLQMLSEIAQEYGVEWDLAAAAREMLPPGSAAFSTLLAPASTPAAAPPPAAAAAAPMPQHPAPPIQPAPAVAPPGQMTAQAAAAAAAAAAAHARAASEYAAQLAAQVGGGAGSGSGGPPGGGGGQVMMPPPGPQQGGLPGGGPASGGPAPSYGVPPGGFSQRTEEEIQRAYDEAVGPPVKGALAPPPEEPSAPGRAPSLPSVPVPLPKPPTGDVDPMRPNLPTPPHGLGAPPVEDEYDELSRRLDALKRN